MNSRVSWSIEGIDPSVRERAEAAARRAGMSLNDWLDSAIGAGTSPDFRHPADHLRMPPSREASEVADIHQRLDAITRQIEQMSRRAQRYEATGGTEQGVAHQLNDAISRLDARLSQISISQTQRQAQAYDRKPQSDPVERAAAELYGNSAPLSPASLEVAVAEIAARQRELEAAASRQVPPRDATPAASAPDAPPVAPTPDFSSLERHLIAITSQIEALQHPDDIEHSIASFRSELAEIRLAITEAMPRRAIESIESEIRALSQRINENRRSAIDAQQFAGIERALSEIREALRSLTPAEQLAGYDDAIRNLGAKLDTILRANDDPATVQQLEAAIAALRAIVSNIASNDALTRLSDDVLLLSAKVDQLTSAADHTDNFTTLGHRLDALASTLESRPQSSSASTEHLESAIRALSERLDRMELGKDSASTLQHLEQRVTYLLERLEATAGNRSGDLSRVEAGLHDVLRHLERQQTTFAALAESGARRASEQQDPGLIDILKRELSDIRFSQTETNRHTQDSLEAVHNALGHVVDRLATIEGDLRVARAAPSSAAAPAVEPDTAAQHWPTPPQPKPELPNPAAPQAPFAAAPREFGNAGSTLPLSSPVAPKPIGEVLEPLSAPVARGAIAADLPPDHPLEPGTRPAARTPAERIAASESAISEIPAAPRPPVSSSSFIAAARRAAQAAAAQAPAEKAGRNSKGAEKAKNPDNQPSTITSRIRSLLVGASVVVIVLSTFKFTMTLLDAGGAAQPPAIENSSEPEAQPPADPPVKPAVPDQLTPSMTSPTPIGKQSLNTAPPGEAGGSLTMPHGDAPVLGSPAASSDITGALPLALTQPPPKLGTIQVPPGESLPDAIGGAALRTAALEGDPRAAYEVAVRFAEGKGVAANFEEAAKWYDRSAQAGVVPAIFRLGTLYEKGLGVKRDVDLARRYYLQAAERGNAKAMHNLAVLEADGGGRGANYRSAAEWFRKAADRGVADSQFNLGILYARGIGVEQNLAESFKWFSLAAAQGDADAARKRDDIAKRLDAQSLAAARLAIQTFTPEPQPDEAVNVVSPPGGWDAPPSPTNPVKSAAKPGLIKRASR